MFYCMLDLSNAFFRIPLDASPQDQFAFTWDRRQGTFQVLPQGCLHSPTICHGMVSQDLEIWQKPHSELELSYIDDIMLTCDDLSLLS